MKHDPNIHCVLNPPADDCWRYRHHESAVNSRQRGPAPGSIARLNVAPRLVLTEAHKKVKTCEGVLRKWYLSSGFQARCLSENRTAAAALPWEG
ncbi:hypothetical protein FJQ55_20680 [Rhizobium glycinendophyticum]|uniref:Uncharacterized protein n=1 Tax=Rhizobium glycinendophyticum TaxID=2589807 RepID=A0A504TTF8_9HYPH|nr:hypothetical protein FJQ55_20680 [Rhizobium glycinendophyticum]